MFKILFFLFVLISITAQPETGRWTKKEIDYRFEIPQSKSHRIDNSSISTLLASTAQTTYYFLISEHDGDNCPFYPSCSAFFVQSVKEYNFIKAFFMFGDRFTRDLNYLKGLKKYPLHSSGKFYDPPCNYSLNRNRIVIYPPNEIVDEEN